MVDQSFENPFPSNSIDHLLYRKNWVDTVQWHYEDLIRDPHIDPVEGMNLKRKIDASNQDRTDIVEYIDGYFLDLLKILILLNQPQLTQRVQPGQSIDCPYWS